MLSAAHLARSAAEYDPVPHEVVFSQGLTKVGNAKGAHVGTLTTYSVSNIVGHASEAVDLNAIDFGGGVFVLSGCVFPDSLTACLVGATGPAAHLSGRVASFPGESSIGVIAGVTVSDLILKLTGSLP